MIEEYELEQKNTELIRCQEEIRAISKEIFEREQVESIRTKIALLQKDIHEKDKELLECRSEIESLCAEIQRNKNHHCKKTKFYSQTKRRLVNNLQNKIPVKKRKSAYCNIDFDAWFLQICHQIGGQELVNTMCHAVQQTIDSRDIDLQWMPDLKDHQTHQEECFDL